MTNYAHEERLALADLLGELGPEAPTLCEGWTTRDLAAHLVIRERRPDAAAGILLSPLAGYLDRQQRKLASRPYAELVELVRTGPPRWSPFGLPGVDERANLAEFFVHHEDVRRAQDGAEPRALEPGLAEALGALLRSPLGRLLFRRSPVGVIVAPDGATELQLRAGAPAVRIVGPAPEILLYGFGRTGAARVALEGDEAVVERFRATRLGV